MNLIVKIAWRNIQRHRGKSLIIGSILFVGALLMTVGNGVISGMDRGLQKNIVEGFSGDAVLVSDKQESDNVFLEMMARAIEPITNFKQIDSALKSVPQVRNVLPMGKNTAMALTDEGIISDGVFVLGVDIKRYREFFPNNLEVLEGAFPEDNTKPFVLMPTGWRKLAGEYYSMLYTPEGCAPDTATLSKEIKDHLSDMTLKHSVVYMGMSLDNSTTDVRVPVAAVVKYRSLNTIWGSFPILDIESYRECLGYFSAAAQTSDIKEETQELLDAADGSLDDLFGEENLVVAQKKDGAPEMLEAGALAVQKDSLARGVDLDAGTFNMVLLRLSEYQNIERAVVGLNEALADKGLGVRAVSWKKATGMIGSMAMLIKTSLFVFVMFLFFVAIIIIVNTLSMAAIERTTEIGMMRAVGARKGFIRLMFLGETGVLSVVFGGAGILVGIVAVNIVAAFNITTDQDMLQLLYGGDTFRPLLSLFDIGLVVIQLIIVTLIAVIYPIRVASSITPLDAVSRE